MNVKLLWIFLLLLGGMDAMAGQPDTFTLQGLVIDATGHALPGANVTKVSNRETVITDEQGRFTFQRVSVTDTLIVSFMGFADQIVTDLKPTDPFVITLQDDNQMMEEVVVIGYGSQQKGKVTGSISTVNMDEVVGNRPISTMGQALEGVVPGLQATSSSGEPGSSKSLNIRGATGINGSGNNIQSDGPLILLDNVPFNGPLNMIDPNDIETITVLKDAGSAAIYGARSGFGVILITSKTGARNQPTRFSYSNNFTFSTPMDKIQKAKPADLITAYQDMGTTTYVTGQNVEKWMKLMQEYQADPSRYPEGFAVVENIRYQLKESDAIGNLFGKNVFQHIHNAALTGGSDKTTFRISMGVVNEDGIIAPETKQDNFQRYNVKSVVTTQVAPWLNLQLDASYYHQRKSFPGVDALNATVNLPSYAPLEDSLTVNGQTEINGSPRNRVSFGAPQITRHDDLRLTGRVIVKPMPDLTVTGEYTFDNLRQLNTVHNKTFTFMEPRNMTINNGGSSLFRKNNQLTDYKALNLFANYSKSLRRHHFAAMLGYNQEENHYEMQMVENTDMISNDLPSISQGTGILMGDDAYTQYAIQGVFGRFNYDFADKYLLEINGRYDASSKFPEGSRGGFFPSFSVGWRVSEEGFWQTIKPLVNELKLRGSVGTVGNQQVAPYQFVPGMGSYYPAWLNDGAQVISLNPPDIVSSGFTWASVETKNIGLDIALFKNRLTASADWFNRTTRDMLYKGIQLPAVLGANAPLQNVADLSSKGIELTLQWSDQIGAVRYHIGASLYDYQAEITKIQNEGGLLSQYYVGQRLGEIWGYTTDRLYTVNDFVEGTLNENLTGGTLKEGIAKPEGAIPNPGDVLYKDLNGDGIINAGASTLSDPGDQSVIGNETYRYQFGWEGGLSYKNFSFSIRIAGAGKNQQWRNNILKFPNHYAFGTIFAHQLDYWTPERTDAYFPRIYDGAGGNRPFNEYVQTKYLYNGAYWKIKNIGLSYQFRKALLQRVSLERLEVFCSVENPFTVDHLPPGMDADITKSGRYGMAYPYMRMTSFGINLSF